MLSSKIVGGAMHHDGNWSRRSPLATRDRITEDAKLLDGDLDDVARLEGEWSLWDEGSPRAEQDSVGKVILEEEIGDQFIEAALEFACTCFALPVDLTIALDDQANSKVVGIRYLPGGGNSWSQRAAVGIDFGLRQIQRVFALDTARTHVVANGVADNLGRGVDDEHKLWLWDVPG